MLEYAPINSMTDLLTWHPTGPRELTNHELSIFFTVFVMLQFWNMFNARAFATGKSTFHFKDCKGFGINCTGHLHRTDHHRTIRW